MVFSIETIKGLEESINIDEESELADKYEVYSIPCLVVFKDGQEIKRNVGFIPEEEILNLVGEK